MINDRIFSPYDVTFRRADPLANAAQLATRRCASGGPSPVERRSAKTDGMLVLDLRPWKSFDNLSSATEAHHDNFDNFEVMNEITVFSQKLDGAIYLNQSRFPILS